MTRTRLWIYGAIAGILILGAATTCGYERGVSHGKSVALISRDDSVRKDDKTLIASLVQRAHVADALTKEAIVERDTALVRLERAQARRDTSRKFAKAERDRFTLKGDTATIDALDYVLPQTITTYIRLEDTAYKKQGELDAIHAEADSNASRTIARLLASNATKDTLIETQRVALLHSEGEIKDLKAEKAPRLSFVQGVIAGSLGLLAVARTIAHFVR